MNAPFDERSVTLQVKGNLKVQWGTHSIQVYYFPEVSDSQRLFKPFLTVLECLFSFFFFK